MDAGAVAALRFLASKIETEETLRDRFLEWSAGSSTQVRPPPVDNVSIPTYLKFCEQLGLTPAGRVKALAQRKEPTGGTLGKLRAVAKGQTA